MSRRGAHTLALTAAAILATAALAPATTTSPAGATAGGAPPGTGAEIRCAASVLALVGPDQGPTHEG
jgi:hypothetical protein